MATDIKGIAPSVGARVSVADRGRGTVALDNEDGTWNVDFDDESEGDFPTDELEVVEEVISDMCLGSTTNPSALLIWFHGMTDTPDGWYSIFSSLLTDPSTPLFSKMQFKLPCAPLQRVSACTKVTTSWFDVQGLPMTMGRPDPGTGQRESIDRALRYINNAVASGIPPSHIAIGGHSQGGALALAAALQSSLPVAGCVVLSGWVLPSQDLASCAASSAAASGGTRFLVCHGDKDCTVHLECGEHAAELLQKNGCVVENSHCEVFSGMGHNGCREDVLRSIQNFLNGIFESLSVSHDV